MEEQTYISRNVRESTFECLCPAKIKISLPIRAVWSESLLSAFWITKDATYLHADIKDTDQTVQMRSLIWVLVGGTCH